jgi:hypothetical protein
VLTGVVVVVGLRILGNLRPLSLQKECERHGLAARTVVFADGEPRAATATPVSRADAESAGVIYQFPAWNELMRHELVPRLVPPGSNAIAYLHRIDYGAGSSSLLCVMAGDRDPKGFLPDRLFDFTVIVVAPGTLWRRCHVETVYRAATILLRNTDRVVVFAGEADPLQKGSFRIVFDVDGQPLGLRGIVGPDGTISLQGQPPLRPHRSLTRTFEAAR